MEKRTSVSVLLFIPFGSVYLILHAVVCLYQVSTFPFRSHRASVVECLGRRTCYAEVPGPPSLTASVVCFSVAPSSTPHVSYRCWKRIPWLIFSHQFTRSYTKRNPQNEINGIPLKNALMLAIGSLSNDDGNCNENITRKCIFISFVLLRDYFNSLNFYKNGKLSRNQIGRSGVQVTSGDTPGDFIRRSQRIWSPAKIGSDFRHRLMRTHLAIFFANRGDMAALKTHVIKSPNLMGWLYWRFAAINVENRGNGHTWRMPANLIADIWHVRYRRFYTPIAAIDETRNRCTGHTWQVCRWLKKENEKFTVVRPRSPQNLKCGHFTLLFCRGRQEMYQNVKRTCRAIVFAH